jgi:hypothetical protein
MFWGSLLGSNWSGAVLFRGVLALPLFAVHRPCLAAGALATIGSCGGSVRGSGNADAGGPEVGAGAQASAEAGSDAGRCLIRASDYDQSCSVDSDCLSTVVLDSGPFASGEFRVSFGNYCGATCPCELPQGAISERAAAQYVADVSKTRLVSEGPSDPAQFCGCTLTAFVCCQNGGCTARETGCLAEAGPTALGDGGG